MRLEHHLVGGYVRYISPYIIIIIIPATTVCCARQQFFAMLLRIFLMTDWRMGMWNNAGPFYKVFILVASKWFRNHPTAVMFLQWHLFQSSN